MNISKQKINGVIPYLIIVQNENAEWIFKANKKRNAMFKSKEKAEECALELSKKHPKWKFTVKLSNGIPL